MDGSAIVGLALGNLANADNGSAFLLRKSPMRCRLETGRLLKISNFIGRLLGVISKVIGIGVIDYLRIIDYFEVTDNFSIIFALRLRESRNLKQELLLCNLLLKSNRLQYVIYSLLVSNRLLERSQKKG